MAQRERENGGKREEGKERGRTLFVVVQKLFAWKMSRITMGKKREERIQGRRRRPLDGRTCLLGRSTKRRSG
jgi:hypothetical protein